MTIREGDIFVATWGYDQTNADFFQVVKVTNKSVSVRHIKSNQKVDSQTLVGFALPIRGDFDGSTKTKRIRIYEGQEEFDAGESYGLARKWDGQPVAISSYA